MLSVTYYAQNYASIWVGPYTEHMLHNKTNYLLAGLLWWSFFFTTYCVEAHGPSVLYDTTHIGVPVVTLKQNISLAAQHILTQ